MSDSQQQGKVIIEHHYDRPPKEIVIAYILWLFLGSIGMHRFYTGRIGSGITMLILSIIGWATSWILIGFIPLGIVGIWLLIDIFLIPGMCRYPR